MLQNIILPSTIIPGRNVSPPDQRLPDWFGEPVPKPPAPSLSVWRGTDIACDVRMRLLFKKKIKILLVHQHPFVRITVKLLFFIDFGLIVLDVS